MPKWEYEERQARLRFPLLVSPILNFLHSHDDCFAAQIVYATGPRPPMYRLVSCSRSFHLQFTV